MEWRYKQKNFAVLDSPNPQPILVSDICAWKSLAYGYTPFICCLGEALFNYVFVLQCPKTTHNIIQSPSLDHDEALYQKPDIISKVYQMIWNEKFIKIEQYIYTCVSLSSEGIVKEHASFTQSQLHLDKNRSLEPFPPKG